MNVAVLGASDNPEKYSYKAVQMLKESGHQAFPVHPVLKTTQELKTYPSIRDIEAPIHTVTLYISKDISTRIADEILAKKPKRIIFNPGAENPALAQKAYDQGIQALEACTLVLLRTQQF